MTEHGDSANDFLDMVQIRAGLVSRAAARDATAATLRTLMELMPDEYDETFSESLPGEIEKSLAATNGPDETFPVDEFLDRVANRERNADHLDEVDAFRHSDIVIGVLAISMDQAVWRTLLAQLPPEYKQRFGDQSPIGELSG